LKAERRSEEPYPLDLCAHELFSRQAGRTPSAVAAACGGQSLTYGELDEKSRRLSRYLAEAGVRGESRVGIHLRRSPEALIAVLGVLRAGAAYVPLEAGLPAQRLEYMLGDSGVGCVLVESGLMESLPLGGFDVVLMDGAGTDPDWLAEFAEEPADGPEPHVTPDTLAYVLYTSGSTGRPKGVMVEHRGLTNYLCFAAESYLTEGIEGSVVSLPLGFDATLTTLLAPLVAGRRVELLPDDERTMGLVAERLFGERPLLFKLTPAHLEALQYVERPAQAGQAAHVIVVGGEQLGAALLARWKRELLPHSTFVNEYGPTEAVVGCTSWTLSDEAGLAVLEGRAAAPIGRPIPNTQLYVLGEAGRPQPPGGVGELYIGGAGVARGYLNLGELTRERFIPNPFGDGRLYRTGDLVRWLDGGELAFVGRDDDQVKVRGYRIELGEIEAALAEVEGVRAAAAAVREDIPGQKRLVAYVTTDEGAMQGAGESELVGVLRNALRSQLPDYMMPSAYVLLDELPLTPNGKVDRKALPAPQAGQAQAAHYVPPRNPVERAICEVWEEVLNRADIGVEDNFFSLGGDSILSIRVASLLRARGISIDIKDIFQHQTVALLAEQARDSSSVEGSKLEPFGLLNEEERAALGSEYEDAYPMSALQAGMVFHTQLENFSGVYHDIVADHVKCPWDEESFARALAACVEEHPILRTGFLLDGERPLQAVRRDVEPPLEVEDLRGQSDEEQERYVSEWVERRKLHAFDWERGPLFQVNIFLRTEETFQFAVSFHHSVLDGWSRAVLTTELYNRYERLLSGGELDKADADWTYRDFVAQEQRVLADPEARQFFARMLEDAPTRQLPRLKAAGGGQRSQAQFVVERFTPLSGGLVELSKRLGVPVQSVLLAGHFKVLSTMDREGRAVSCVTHNGRPESEGAERSLGLYLNSLPLSLKPKEGSWRELIGATAGVNAASMQYRGYPLSKIQQDVGLSFEEVTFNYTHFHAYREMAAATGHTLEVLGSHAFEQTNFDLVADVSRGMDGDSMSLRLFYDREVFDDDLIERLGQYYVRAFELMLAGLDEPHHSRPLLGEEERQRLLAGWNETAVEYPAAVSVHELFEAQVERDPEAVALAFGESTLTYRQLNERANQLAHRLRAGGVGSDTLVGLCVERSPALVVAMLGVSKAGGAYVPFEPTHPRERLDFMMRDSAPALLITQSSLRGSLDDALTPLLVLDEEWGEGVGLPTHNPAHAEVGLTGQHLAYVIYTSGSTGRPKGVQVSHESLLNLVFWHRGEFGVTEDDRATQLAGVAFDASVWEIWPYLSAGASIHFPDEETRLAPERLRDWLVEQGVTISYLPTPLAEQVLPLDWPPASRLRALLTGGDRLYFRPRESLPFRLVNNYGPTENTVVSTFGTVEPGPAAAAPPPIGRPVANVEVYVLDSGFQPVPQGAAGELFVGGRGLARGYLNRPGLTARQFVPHPYSKEPGARLYRTGDLVRYLPGGEVEFLGRIDYQVKVRGHRIEPGEIEAALAGLEGVAAAVVSAREDEPGHKRLVAYVVPHEYGSRDEGQAARGPLLVGAYREALAARLPEYMVPSAFVLLRELPLTPNGKVDRKALPKPDAEQAQAAQYVAPRNAVEQAVCEVWQEVLGYERVGAEDNFFNLGGDSILSIRAVALLKGRGLSVNVRDIFRQQTVEQLAAHAMHQARLAMSRLSDEAAEQRERLSATGKEIEEGII
jgi:amino acid adenylation domain-containing protein